MENKMNAIPKESINNIFNQSKYEIPIYQRNYAWGKEEIERLIEDISDFTPNEDVNEYFLGNLIVDKIKDSENSYSVIDGQQRLTTLFLLLKYLGVKTQETTPLSFQSRDKSNKTLEYIANGDYADKEFVAEEIIKGYEIIEKYFESQPNKEEFIKSFQDKFEKINLLRIQVPKDIDLNHYFEIMNTRGEQLELHEIVKARILQQINNNSEKKTAAMIWDACSNMDSYVQMNFAKKYRYALFGDYKNDGFDLGWNSFTHKSFADIHSIIESEDSNGDLDKTESETEKYSKLSEILKSGIDKNTEKNVEGEEQERFSSIIDFPSFVLQVNVAMQNTDSDEEHSLDDKLFLKTLAHNWAGEESAKQFIFKLLESKFKFDKYIVKREKHNSDSNDDGKWSLKQLSIYRPEGANGKGKDTPQYKNSFTSDNNNRHVLMLQASMRITFTSPKVMHWINRILQLELTALNETNIIATLENYCVSKLEDFETYNGFAIPRIVFTYLDYILWRDSHAGIDKNWEITYRTSIEHFSPQHPTDGKEVWGDELNILGNLALISVSSNSKFSNLDPLSKISSYPSIEKQSPKLALMFKDTKTYGWTTDTAKEHDEKMKSILDKEIQRVQKLNN